MIIVTHSASYSQVHDLVTKTFVTYTSTKTGIGLNRYLRVIYNLAITKMLAYCSS